MSWGFGQSVLALIAFTLIAMAGFRLIRYHPRKWRPALATIVGVDVKERVDYKTPVWMPHITFEYEVNRTLYTSSRYNVDAFAVQGSQVEATALATTYALGQSVNAFYLKSDPSIAVLKLRGGEQSRSHTYALIVAGILLLTAAILVGYING
jgi:Protein of unknown function (DUF3592)